MTSLTLLAGRTVGLPLFPDITPTKQLDSNNAFDGFTNVYRIAFSILKMYLSFWSKWSSMELTCILIYETFDCKVILLLF